ncbi:unnamed protein product [Somion occarium]|uniref:Rab-GAP TBC domain-containing protein n=1 Tax=Somion occarium TaxID=3059160 RepID=A0ABP1D8Y4_9APHY
MRAPDGSYDDGLIIPGTNDSPPRIERTSSNLDRNNPLSLHDEVLDRSVTPVCFMLIHSLPIEPLDGMVCFNGIAKDDIARCRENVGHITFCRANTNVRSRFPDIGYFRDNEVQTQLTNILFVYSVTHPDIGYRQGMHELLAPLYYAVDYDSILSEDPSTSSSPSTSTESSVKAFCSRLWVGADAWALFDAVMRGAGRWYEWRESKDPMVSEKSSLSSHVQLNVVNDHSIKPYIAPIVQACNRIQSTYLKAVDPELWRKMQSAGIEPQIYGIRWLRLLFTREFSMSNAMILWDGLFACDPTLDLAQWVCVAMLIRIRNQLIPSDYSGQLTYLLRYPSQPASTTIHSSSLLIRQALTLQMSPTATTGVSIVHENRNLLNIPIEVPEPPPPPMRRRAKLAERGQSLSSSEPGSSSSRSPQLDANANRLHTRQGSTPMGLPEMIARGLLERGESLGINKTVMNAVSELKRNLPDLANSLARFPQSSSYPLEDERPPSERPPWEPRTRFEMERDVSEMRALQQRLGDSVTWIVDTLLLDESNVKDVEEAKSIKSRKREALESLAYVRDVLKETVSPSELDEERLSSEEQLKAKKAKAVEGKQDILPSQGEVPTHRRPVQHRLPVSPPLPAPAAAPPVTDPRARPTVHRGSGDYFPPTPVVSGGPSTTFSTKPPLQIPRQMPPPTPVSSAPALTPNANATPVAPWNYTKSSFSSSPIATLPRIPPKSSTTLRFGSVRTPMAVPPLQTPPTVGVSRDQAPRKQNVQHDPLGAIP